MHWWFKQGVNFGSYLDKCSQGWVSLSRASAVCIYNTQHMLAALPLKEGGYKTKPTRPKQKYFFFFLLCYSLRLPLPSALPRIKLYYIMLVSVVFLMTCSSLCSTVRASSPSPGSFFFTRQPSCQDWILFC